jgi:hypothetical protein
VPTSTNPYIHFLIYRLAPHLKYLVEFYAIDSYPIWGMTNRGLSDEEGSKRNSEGSSDEGRPGNKTYSLSLDEAVAKYPEQGVQELANVVGLVANGFKQFLLNALLHKKRPQQPPEKRSRSQLRHISREDTKRPRLASPQPPEPVLSLSQLLLPDRKQPDSPQSEETRIGYGDTSSVIRQQVETMIAEAKAEVH